MRRSIRKHSAVVTHFLSRSVVATLVAGAVIVPARAIHAAASPEQACQKGRYDAAAKYAACQQNAEAKLATSGDSVKYNDTLAKCGTKFTGAWQKAIDKAAATGATCLDAPLTGGDFQTILAASSDNVADALAGLGLVDCGDDLGTCTGDLGTCTSDLGTCTRMQSNRWAPRRSRTTASAVSPRSMRHNSTS